MSLCYRDLSKKCEGKYRDCTDCVLDKIRAEIIEKDKNVKAIRSDGCCFFTANEVLAILDKYKAESEDKHDTDR